MTFDGNEAYKKLKTFSGKFSEEIHCPMILDVMFKKGRLSAFCVEANITERTFYNWVSTYQMFMDCYSFGKMLAREKWEKEGLKVKDRIIKAGTTDNNFEYWKLIGWSRFGVSKNPRLKLNLNPGDNPAQHYAQLLAQAKEGDFTAAEIKQLMEAINVGLNAHQVFELQKEIDTIKSDLAKMGDTKNGDNIHTVKGTA